MGFDVTKDISHRDDVPWYDAPVPPVKHRCFPQTSGWVELNQWLRCPCGAIASGRDLKAAKGLETYETDDDRWNGLWLERNSRRSPTDPEEATMLARMNAWASRITSRRWFEWLAHTVFLHIYLIDRGLNATSLSRSIAWWVAAAGWASGLILLLALPITTLT